MPLQVCTTSLDVAGISTVFQSLRVLPCEVPVFIDPAFPWKRLIDDRDAQMEDLEQVKEAHVEAVEVAQKLPRWYEKHATELKSNRRLILSQASQFRTLQVSFSVLEVCQYRYESIENEFY